MFRIVIADDEEMARERLYKYISRIPNTKVVASFRNGHQVIEYLKSNIVNLVISDIRMPLVDGLELAQWMVENVPQCELILVSAYNEFDYAKKAIDCGVKSYLLKPLIFDEVKESIVVLQQKKIEQLQAAMVTKNLNHEKLELSIKRWIKRLGQEVPDSIKGKKCTLYAFNIEGQKQDDHELMLTGLGNVLRYLMTGETVFYLGKKAHRDYFALFCEQTGSSPEIQEINEMLDMLSIKETETESVVFFESPEELQAFWNATVENEDEIISKVKQYITQNLKGSISRDEAAQSVYMEYAYFSRYFKKKTGLSFQDYVREVRLEKAKQLLKKGWRVKDVCEEVGYQDRNYFNKLFRQHTGYSPVDYKRHLGLKQNESDEI